MSTVKIECSCGFILSFDFNIGEEDIAECVGCEKTYSIMVASCGKETK